jgi:hypothetical protein
VRRDELLRRARGAPEDAPAEVAPPEVAVLRAEPREGCAASVPSFEAPNALDAQFSALVHDIQQRLALLARAPTIRVEKWLRKLHDPVSNVTWKKLRNDYARLLRHNLSLGATSPPFDKAPDDGPLRNLLPDEKARFKGDGFGDASLGAAKKKQSASSKTLFDASSTKTKTTTTTSYDGVLDETEAETALRDLLRRANVAGAPRPLGAAEIATAVPPPLQGLFEDDSANPFADVDRVALQDDERHDSTGVSREMRAFIAAEGVGGGVDEFEASVASRNAPVADVVAALGAEREKCKELEWRLRRAETALETCRRELNETRLAATAMRDLKAEEIREIRASHKRELDRLIAHFERRRAEVHGPRVDSSLRIAGVDTSAFVSKHRTNTSYDASKENRRALRRDSEREKESAAEKEKDFFAYLEAFQRNTGELRKRATISGADS